MVDRERKGSSRPGGRRKSGGGEEGARRVADARVLHTPLHLLVNRINQRHHGLSPIPLRLRASTFLNLLSHFLPRLPPPPASSLALAPSSPPPPPYPSSLPPLRTPSRSIVNAHRHSLTAPLPGTARDRKTRQRKRRVRKDGEAGEGESRRRATLGEAIDA